MKVTAERKALADVLAWVGQAISARPANPVLAGIRLVAGGSTLTVSAFDYERSHEARLDVEVGEPGECLVMGGFIRSIVTAMSGSTVDLALDGPSLSIASGRATYKARTLDLANYPDLPGFPATVGSADAAELAAAVASVKHTVDVNSTVEGLRGLRLEGANELVLVGTDRFRIASAKVTWKWEADLRVTVPADGVESAVKGMSGTVTIGHRDGSFGLRDETRAVTLRTYVDAFPTAWERLLAPPEGAQTIVVDSTDLKVALKRVREVEGDGVHTIAVDFAPGDLVLSGRAEAGEGDDAITAETTGTGRVGFNPRYLAETLAAVPSGAITIHAGPKGIWVLEPMDHPHLSFAVNSKRLPQEAS